MPNRTRTNKIAQVVVQRQQGVVVFEDISDPHNAAAALRSADAFGFSKIYFIFEKEVKFDPKRIGKASSSSANKWLEFSIFTSIEECFATLKQAGFISFATVISEKAQSLFETKFTKPNIALLFGNEHRGLSETAISLADQQVTIPMRGMVESFNLSVTAALCMYEVTRQRIQMGMEKYRLPKIEQGKLVKNFLEK